MTGKSYQPTGRPPGRPRKDAPPEPPRQVDVRELLRDRTRSGQPMNALCQTCFPVGWMDGIRTAQCRHGVWVKRDG